MPLPLNLTWDEGKPRDWLRPLSDSAAAGPVALEQSFAYGAAVAAQSSWQVRRASVRSGRRLLAQAQFFSRRLGPLTIDRLLRGPVLSPDCTAEERLQVAAQLTEGGRLRTGRPLFWTPEEPDGAEVTGWMRQAGKRRMLTGYSTVMLDLQQPSQRLRADLDRQFRRSLVRAESGRMRIEATHGGAGLDWLLDRHEAERRRRRFVAPSAALARAITAALPGRQDLLALTARDGSTTLAGMLFLRHGNTATYYIGATTPEGRTARAHHRLIWQAMLTLQGAGVRWLDLGGLNTDTMAGVAGFKLGLGGRLVTLSGTWL
jgi:hypothetical protein